MQAENYLEAMAVARDLRLDVDERASRLARLLGLDDEGRRVIAEAIEVAVESDLESLFEAGI